MDSCASVIQLNLVFVSDALAFSVFETTVCRMHAWENALLHGIAAALGVSNFRLAFLKVSLYSSSLGSIEGIPRKFLAYLSFGFSIAHFFFWTASQSVTFSQQGQLRSAGARARC